MTALETKAAPRARDAGDTLDGGRPWRCHRCGRYLATIYGHIYETPGFVEGKPGSTRGNLPAVLVCTDERCRCRNIHV